MTHVYDSEQVYLLAFDETTEGKSRTKTHGIGQFYSGTAQKPVNGISLFALSLIEVGTKTSSLLGSEQVVLNEEDKARNLDIKLKTKERKKRKAKGETLKRGRPKKSTQDENKKTSKAVEKVDKTETQEDHGSKSASYRAFKTCFERTIKELKESNHGKLPQNLKHGVCDSGYGSLPYVELLGACGMHLISRLRSNAALFELPEEDHGKKGRRHQFGKRIKIEELEKTMSPVDIKTDQKKGFVTYTYQFKALSKSIKGHVLNVVVMETHNIKEGKRATNIWFTTDLDLGHETLLNYYSLRFQIEFDFRDAKQFFGLSDFKNYKKENVESFVNLSFSMCLVSKIMIRGHREQLGMDKFGLHDLKVMYMSKNKLCRIMEILEVEGINIPDERVFDKFLLEDLVCAA